MSRRVELPAHALIGFAGAAGSGKDSCARILAEYGFRGIAFADALRREVAEAWRVDERMLTDRDTKEWDIPALAIANCGDPGFVRVMHRRGNDLQAPRSPRFIMQRWGTEYRRAVQGDYWTSIVARWVGRMRAIGYHRLVVSDVRFINERDTIVALGGAVVRVHRPDTAGLAHNTSEHVSEAGDIVLGPLEVVHNDGDFDHLHNELLRVLAAARPGPSITTANHEGADTATF